MITITTTITTTATITIMTTETTIRDPLLFYVEKVVEVPVERIVEKLVEKIVEVEKIAEVPVERIAKSVDVKDAQNQAEARVIAAESELRLPTAMHGAKYEEGRGAHSTKYPGGTLPTELRSFDSYMKYRESQLDYAERASLQCLSCGKYPWT